MATPNSKEIYPIEVASQTPRVVLAALIGLGERWNENEIAITADGRILHNQESTSYQIEIWERAGDGSQDSIDSKGRLMLVRRRA